MKIATSAIFIGILFLVLIRVQDYVPVDKLTRDPAAIVISPFYYGAVSNLGIQLWTATAVVCALSVVLLHILQGSRESKLFLMSFGCLSFVLGLDDLFMLHEIVFPNNVGIPEEFVLTGYIVTFLLCLFRFRKLIFRTQPGFLLLSIALFAFSVAFDVLPKGTLSDNNIYWIEDGAKFIAILAWLLYFVWVSVRSVLLSVDTLIAEQSSADTYL